MAITNEYIISKVRQNFKVIRQIDNPYFTPKMRRHVLRIQAWIYARRRFSWMLDYPKFDWSDDGREEDHQEEDHEGEGQVRPHQEQPGALEE